MRLRTRCLVASFVAVAIVITVLASPPAARASNGVLNPPHSDAGLDTNGNALWDYLVISVGATVSTPGGFFLFLQLYDAAGTTLITQSQKLVDLPGGTSVTAVRLEGSAIWRAGIDGPYRAQIALVNDTFSLQGMGFHATAAYLSIDFEPTPARLAPPHSDAGVDMDGDSRFDYLSVDVQVDVATAGTYAVQGLLWDSPPTTLIRIQTNTTYLAPGTHTVLLRFPGAAIRAAGLNGPYEVTLDLFGSTGPQLDTGTHVTSTYFLSDFDPLAAAFTSPHESLVVDLDRDGFWDDLVVNAIVTATEPGFYRVDAGISSIPAFANVRTYLPGGTQVVQLDFLGVDIFNSGVDGPYTVDLTLWDEHARNLDVDIHTTGTYFAIDFEPSPPARWVPPFLDSVRDLQGDGFWDDLVVNTSVLADRHGGYSWTIELWDSAMTTFIGTADGQFELSSGTNPASLAFPGLQIWNSGVDGPYGVNLVLYEPEGRQVDVQTFTTAPYLATDFQGPAGRLTPPYFDLGVDRNGDTILDVIAVDVPITVTRGSTFILTGIMVDGSFGLVGFDQRFVDLQPGLSTVRLNFSAADAFRGGPDGAFFGILQLQTISAGTTLFVDGDTFMTRNYTGARFDQGPPVRLTGRATAAGSGAPLEDIGIIAWSPATRLQRSANTDVSGSYEMTLPPGDYYVFADGASRNAQGVFQTVTSDRSLNFVLDLPAPSVVTGSVSFSDWSNATFVGDFTFGADAVFTRFQFDVVFGNGDGIASQAELDRLFEFGTPPSLPLTTRDTFTVDGRSYVRANGTETFTLSGAGPITSSAPLTGRVTGDYAASSAVPSMTVHVGRFLTEFDTVSSTQTFTLGWPSNFAMTSFDPVAGVAITGVGGPSAGIDPASDPNPRDFVREVWVNTTIETTDTTPPLVTGAALDAASTLRSRPGPTVTVTATASDAGRGDWPIQGANFTRGARNWASAVPMSATDGSFDGVTEAVTGALATATLADGTYSICVYARDIVTNNDTAGNCAGLTIDSTPPRASTVRVDGATMKTVVVGAQVTLTATVSDASTGNGDVSAANYTRGAANWASSRAMNAGDGAFDSPTESVTAAVDTTGWTAGTYDLCVYAVDDLGNGDPSAADCAQLVVLDRDVTAPVVTGARALPNPANLSEAVNISAVVTDDIGVNAVYIEIFDGGGASVGNVTAAYDPASGRYSVERTLPAPGTYTYRVSARDAEGNWATTTGTFSIRTPPSDGAPLGGLWWLILVVIAVAAAIVVFLLWTRRRRPARMGAMPPAAPPMTGMPAESPPEAPMEIPPEIDEIDKPLPPPPT